MTTLSDLGSSLAGAVASAEASVLSLGKSRCGGTASAIAWSETHALTSHHAVPRDELWVRTSAGDERKAKVVGRDPGTDLALIEVEGGGLTPLSFRDTGDVKVGHLALALGRPGRAIRASLRMVGVVAEAIDTPAGGKLDRYLETDRGIPEGFEGGPLIDADGKGLGLSTDSILRGADLAVPTETLRRVVGELLSHGRVRAGYLGVAVRPVRLPEPLATDLGQRHGALILGVADGSAAAAAGLVLGDVIVRVAGQVVRGPRELTAALRDKHGVATKLEIVRAGARTEVEVTPSER